MCSSGVLVQVMFSDNTDSKYLKFAEVPRVGEYVEISFPKKSFSGMILGWDLRSYTVTEVRHFALEEKDESSEPTATIQVE